jgi:hypothetical protein
MSIASTFGGRSVVGNEVMTWGYYTDSSAATADDIDTKIAMVSKFLIQPYGSTVATNASVCNETLPTSGIAVSMRTDASQTGLWVAFGDRFI